MEGDFGDFSDFFDLAAWDLDHPMDFSLDDAEAGAGSPRTDQIGDLSEPPTYQSRPPSSVAVTKAARGDTCQSTPSESVFHTAHLDPQITAGSVWLGDDRSNVDRIAPSLSLQDIDLDYGLGNHASKITTVRPSENGSTILEALDTCSPPEATLPMPQALLHISPETVTSVHHSTAPSTEYSTYVDRITCPHPLCDKTLARSSWSRDCPTLSAHVTSEHPELLQCQECGIREIAIWKVESHASTKRHAAYRCPVTACASTFSRLDDLRRHYRMHQDDGERYPCPHCKKYKGKNGFKRKDHLTQHLRGYHMIGEVKNMWHTWFCSHRDCSAYRQGLPNGIAGSFEKHAFRKQSDYTKHMKIVHDESPFPCSAPECDRVRGKGFFRERDLIKHRRNKHPELADDE